MDRIAIVRRYKGLLVGYDGASYPSPKLQEALLSELNRLLQVGPLYDAQVFADIELSEETQTLYRPKSEKWRSVGSLKPVSLSRCLSL